MALTPKDIARLLATAAEYMALAETSGLSEPERVYLLHAADRLLDQCAQAGFSVTELRRDQGQRKVH